MKLSINVIAHGLAIAVQAANQLSELIPGKAKSGVALGVGVIQLVISFLAHHSNTDGSPQETAFRPQEK